MVLGIKSKNIRKLGKKAKKVGLSAGKVTLAASKVGSGVGKTIELYGVATGDEDMQNKGQLVQDGSRAARSTSRATIAASRGDKRTAAKQIEKAGKNVSRSADRFTN